MKHKCKLLFSGCCLFLLLLTASCGRKTENLYDPSGFDLSACLADEVSGVRAKGFAADLCVPDSAADQETEGVNAEAYAFFDADGKTVVSQKNIYEKVYPASTTKIMTCLLALELCDPEEYVTVTEAAKIEVAGSSMADLKTGDRLKMKDLLYGLMVPSGNDAAAAIACHISGSIEDFADLMNRKAAELGATHTHFVNPHGLPDEDHYTTVYDMYLIFRKASEYPLFREIASTSSYTAEFTNSKDLTDRTVTWTSGNGFFNGKYTLPEGLSYYAGKTGHTNAAGFCLVLGETGEGGKEYISIIMKAPLYEYLYDGMIRLTRKFSL